MIRKKSDSFKVTDDIIRQIDSKCDFKYLSLCNALTALKQIEDRVLNHMNNKVLTKEEIKKIKQMKLKI
jgi:hypothetical protein